MNRTTTSLAATLAATALLLSACTTRDPAESAKAASDAADRAEKAATRAEAAARKLDDRMQAQQAMAEEPTPAQPDELAQGPQQPVSDLH